MALQIIPAFTGQGKETPAHPYLEIAEFFCDTIQGENFMGWPSAFLRMKKCTLGCSFCDTTEVWRQGAPYTFEELFQLMDKVDLPRKLFEGQHLVLTGGSPLLQQDKLIDFLHEFIDFYEFKPFIEIENECTIMPKQEMIDLVDVWNNSPKLASSGNTEKGRYKPEILSKLSSIKNSWFKFVISSPADWQEILDKYINQGLMRKSQIVLMPEGATRKELDEHRQVVIDLAISQNVRFTDRLHVSIWDKKTGI